MTGSRAIDADELAARLALLRARGLGGSGQRALLARFGSARAVLEADPEALWAAGVPAGVAASLKAPDWRGVEADIAWARGGDRHILPLDSPDYPARLAEIDDPPALLFVHGDPEVLSQPALAVVGSRNPTAGGVRAAREFAAYFAGFGLVVTSGLAAGIDAAAHDGALSGGGLTVAVAGTGLDRVYPARHKALAERIAAEGALVSELPVGAPPLGRHFPARNRIVSGLSLGVLVVEAAYRSGSLITARLASEQGRDVFAMPGSVHNPLARGCHRLIRQGAKLVESGPDVLEDLAGQLGLAEQEVAASAPAPAQAPGPQAEDPEYRRLLEALGHDPVAIDQLVDRSGLTAEEVSSMLLLLELRGLVVAAPGGRYSRATKGPAE